MLMTLAALILQTATPDLDALRASARLTDLRIPPCELELARGDRGEACERFLDTADRFLGELEIVRQALNEGAADAGLSVEDYIAQDEAAAAMALAVLETGAAFYATNETLSLIEAAEGD